MLESDRTSELFMSGESDIPASQSRLFCHERYSMKLLLLPILFALGTALCWGLYGPTIQNARSTTGAWSPFKPYVFIGVAYLVWACAGGLMGMKVKGDVYVFGGDQSPAMIWGFLAGTLGALGALSLTSAMLSGGKPLFVMPIVFGGAVTVTAIVSIIQMKGASHVNPLLWVGMVSVVVGVVLVAMYTPHGHPPKKPIVEQTHIDSETSPQPTGKQSS